MGEHSYGREIAGGRPNETDLMTARRFGEKIIEKISYIGKSGDAKNFGCRETTHTKNAAQVGRPGARKLQMRVISAGAA